MKKIKLLLTSISLCSVLVISVCTYRVMKLTEEVEASSMYVEELKLVKEESQTKVLELEAKVVEMGEVVDKQYEEIVNLQQDVDAKQGLEDLLVDIIMEEGYPKPTEEFARELSKLIISIDKEYEEEFGFESDVAKLMSIIRVESEFSPNCTSYAGAKGLMQLMDATGKSYAGKLGLKEYKPYDPEQNIRVAWYYYNVNKEKMGEDKATVAYNQGYRNLSQAVSRSMSNSRSYWSKVKNHNDKYSLKLQEVLP